MTVQLKCAYFPSLWGLAKVGNMNWEHLIHETSIFWRQLGSLTFAPNFAPTNLHSWNWIISHQAWYKLTAFECIVSLHFIVAHCCNETSNLHVPDMVNGSCIWNLTWTASVGERHKSGQTYSSSLSGHAVPALALCLWRSRAKSLDWRFQLFMWGGISSVAMQVDRKPQADKPAVTRSSLSHYDFQALWKRNTAH